MDNLKFELTNEDRKYLGIEPVQDNWERVKLSDTIYLYFEGNTIKKYIYISNDDYYLEAKMDYETIENRTILLPKTDRGKPKKITPSLMENKDRIGIYFALCNENVLIGNYTTQKMYYSTYRQEVKIKNFSELRIWLNKWITETTEEDLSDIKRFDMEKRVKVNYKEGDFFRFKFDRKNYGYGRIIWDVDKYKKSGKPFWNILMGYPLLVNIYHKITDNKNIEIKELKKLKTIPSQYILRDIFYYGECEIIGNEPLEEHEKDYPIMYGKGISGINEKSIYLQIGPKVHKKLDSRKYLLIADGFNFGSIGYELNITKELLEKCIKENSNNPYWNSKRTKAYKDLRSPEYENIREKVFKQCDIKPKQIFLMNM